METRYSVMFTGELCSGFNFDEVLANFIALTKMEAEKAKKFLSSTKPVLIRKDVDRETAEKYQSGLTKAGLHIELLGSNARPEPSAAATAPGPAYQTSSAPAQAAENPYAAPKADLKVEKKDENGNWLDEPRKVPAFQRRLLDQKRNRLVSGGTLEVGGHFFGRHADNHSDQLHSFRRWSNQYLSRYSTGRRYHDGRS